MGYPLPRKEGMTQPIQGYPKDTHIRYLFVDERRSRRARLLNVTWEDLARCSKTLHDALSAAGITGDIRFINLWDDRDVWQNSLLLFAKHSHKQGWVIIGLGKKVQAQLTHAYIPHRAMIHPAASGALRERARYHAHVRAVLHSNDEKAL